MTSLGRPTRASLERLRYFRYVRPLGGFGGDHDSLHAVARFSDDGELRRILAAFGYAGTPPLSDRHTGLGMLSAGGLPVYVGVNRQAWRPEDQNTIVIDFALYVTKGDVAKAREIEAWFDAHAIAMVGRADQK